MVKNNSKTANDRCSAKNRRSSWPSPKCWICEMTEMYCCRVRRRQPHLHGLPIRQEAEKHDHEEPQNESTAAMIWFLVRALKKSPIATNIIPNVVSPIDSVATGPRSNGNWP